jgi:hypothetical protein
MRRFVAHSEVAGFFFSDGGSWLSLRLFFGLLILILGARAYVGGSLGGGLVCACHARAVCGVGMLSCFVLLVATCMYIVYHPRPRQVEVDAAVVVSVQRRHAPWCSFSALIPDE